MGLKLIVIVVATVRFEKSGVTSSFTCSMSTRRSRAYLRPGTSFSGWGSRCLAQFSQTCRESAKAVEARSERKRSRFIPRILT